MTIMNSFSKAVQDGYQEGRSIAVSGEIKGIVFTGMGISTISGHLIADLAHDAGIPVHICEESNLPGWVDKHCLVVVLSYSGDNDEAITAFSEAQKRKASILIISRGGKLRELNRDYQYPFLKVPYDIDHLTFIPYSFFALFRIFEKEHFLKKISIDVQAASQLPNKSGFNKRAESIANSIKEEVPLVYSTRPSMALAWKRLINYHGFTCFSHTFPSVYYDDLYDIEKLPQGYYLIFITDKRFPLKSRRRLDELKKLLKEEEERRYMELSLAGKDQLMNLLSALYLGMHVAQSMQ